VKPLFGKNYRKAQCRFITAKLVVLPNQVVQRSMVLFVAIALPFIGKKYPLSPILCYFDPVGSNGD
jgi:hypothetical protein